MAVGSKGSFATVDPNQGIIDVAGMARRESARQSELQEKSNLLEGRYMGKSRELADVLSVKDIKGTGNYSVDKFVNVSLSKMKDEMYKQKNDLISGRLGDGESIAEKRAKVNSFLKEADNFANNMGLLTEATTIYQERIANDTLSRAIPSSVNGEDGLMVKLLNGELEGVEIKDSGEPLPVVNGKAYSLDPVIKYMKGAPYKIEASEDLTEEVENFVSRGIKMHGDIDADGNISYNPSSFQKILTETLTPQQKNEVRQKGEARAKDPKFIGDLWFQYTQDETGEGQTGIFTPDDLTDEQIQDVAEWSGNKWVKTLENRFKNELERTFEYSASQAGREFSYKKGKDEAEDVIQLGQPNPANIGQYSGALKSLNKYNKNQGIQTTITDAQFAGAYEIPITNENATFNNIQLTNDSGEFQDYNNVVVKGVTKLPNGTYLIRGDRQVSEGGTVTRSSEQIKRSFEKLDRIPADQLAKYNSEDTDELTKERLFETFKTKYNISEPDLRQAVKTTDKFESFSAVLPEPQQVLPALGIDPQMFATEQSKEQSTKPTFN